MQVGRKSCAGGRCGGGGWMVLSLDDPLPEGILAEITKVPGIRDA